MTDRIGWPPSLRLFRGGPANLPHRRTEQASVDLADIQGNVLRGYTHPTAAYVFLRVDDPTRAAVALERLVPSITTGEPWGETPPDTALQIAFTHAGLGRLGVPAAMLATFPEEFRQGMAARAALLGDRGSCAPSQWEDGLGADDAHVLVTVWGIDDARLQASRDVLHRLAANGGGMTVVNETRAAAAPDGRDHFGFFDGIAQPAIEGSGVAGRRGDGQPDGRGGWRDVATGEFLHGYVDEDGGLPDAPAAPFDRNGTFMVYRKLQMHVARFRTFLDETGRRYPGGAEHLAAKIVGRWRDGTPLCLSPDRPDPRIAADPLRVNDFSYADDPAGLRCPRGSHIRRANPRDHDGFFGGRLTNRHRIVRRGRAYGPPLPDGLLEDDGRERGLAFVCFNASIGRQFETIQRLWMDDGDPLGVGADKDFLIGTPDGGGKMTIPGRPPFFLSPQPQFVTLRGGAYLYQPGISALRWLAAHAAASAPASASAPAAPR